MEIYSRYIFILFFFIFIIIIHELVHYLILKKYGGKGKLGICRGSFSIPTIGIKYLGGLNNWRQVVYMKLAPIPVTFCLMFFLSVYIINPSSFNGYVLAFVYGLALTWITCLKDLRDARYILSSGTDQNFDRLFKPGEK